MYLSMFSLPGIESFDKCTEVFWANIGFCDTYFERQKNETHGNRRQTLMGVMVIILTNKKTLNKTPETLL